MCLYALLWTTLKWIWLNIFWDKKDTYLYFCQSINVLQLKVCSCVTILTFNSDDNNGVDLVKIKLAIDFKLFKHFKHFDYPNISIIQTPRFEALLYLVSNFDKVLCLQTISHIVNMLTLATSKLNFSDYRSTTLC